jgi:hypothetical protein
MTEQLALFQTVALKHSEIYFDTTHEDGSLSAITGKVQDPTPGYALYLPERLVDLPNLIGGANDFISITPDPPVLWDTLFPDVAQPLTAFGVFQYTYTPPA